MQRDRAIKPQNVMHTLRYATAVNSIVPT